MAWTAPVTWTTGQIVMASGTGSLNEQIRDNFLALSGHAHTGAAGDGSATLSGVSFSNTAGYQFADQAADPNVTGTIQRNGPNILYFDGSTAIDLTAADAGAATASLRSLGTSATTAAAGNHQHETIATITDLQRSQSSQGSLGSAFPSSGLPTNQTQYQTSPSGVEYSLLTYTWTPTTADNCYLSVSTGTQTTITYIYGGGTQILTYAVGSSTLTLRLKIDGSTVDTVSNVNTSSAGSVNFDLQKTTNTTAKSIEVTAEFTATSLPHQDTDTDGSGNATSLDYWTNSIVILRGGWDIKQLVFTV